jgi:hypothetical protein
MNLINRNGPRRDPEQIKRDGWREQRLLAVSVEDSRLDAFERQFVINLGTRLYGEVADPKPDRSSIEREARAPECRSGSENDA